MVSTTWGGLTARSLTTILWARQGQCHLSGLRFWAAPRAIRAYPLGSADLAEGVAPWVSLWELRHVHGPRGTQSGRAGGSGTELADSFLLIRLVGQLGRYRGLWQQSAFVNGFDEAAVRLPAITSIHPLSGLAGMMAKVQVAVGASHTSGLMTAGEATGYLPIRTEVESQRRLRVTKGIYLPADIPMHGIFGSKDVIHSWAVPGLGIKVDCIPGYSSHRRLIFR